MRKYIFLVSVTFLCFIIPGVLFSFINHDYVFRFELQFLAAFIPVACILPFVKPKGLAIFILGFFCILELIQFGHYFYFNAPLSVFSLHLMMSELNEIIESASSVIGLGVLVLLSVLIPYVILIFIYCKTKRPLKYKASLAIILMLLILPYKAIFKTPKIANFMPRNDSVSLLNSLKTFTAYIFIYLPSNKAIKTYKEYIVNYKPNNFWGGAKYRFNNGRECKC